MSQKFNWPHPGCVGLWHFEDDGNDSSGEGNNATVGQGVTYIPGKFQRGCRLSVGYYYLDSYESLKIENLTASVWYRSTSDDSPGVIFACSSIYFVVHYSYADYGYRFQTNDGKLELMINGSYLTGHTPINDGSWHWLAATRDYYAARLYVDGQTDAILYYPESLIYHTTGGNYYAGCYIGAAKNPGTVDPASCDLDELMVENFSISPKEALDRYLFQRGMLT